MEGMLISHIWEYHSALKIFGGGREKRSLMDITYVGKTIYIINDLYINVNRIK